MTEVPGRVVVVVVAVVGTEVGPPGTVDGVVDEGVEGVGTSGRDGGMPVRSNWSSWQEGGALTGL